MFTNMNSCFCGRKLLFSMASCFVILSANLMLANDEKSQAEKESQLKQFIEDYAECLLDEKWTGEKADLAKQLVAQIYLAESQKDRKFDPEFYDELFFKLQEVAIQFDRLNGKYLCAKNMQYLNHLAKTGDANRQLSFLCDTLEFCTAHKKSIKQFDQFFDELSKYDEARKYWEFGPIFRNANSIQSTDFAFYCLKRNMDTVILIQCSYDEIDPQAINKTDYTQALTRYKNSQIERFTKKYKYRQSDSSGWDDYLTRLQQAEEQAKRAVWKAQRKFEKQLIRNGISIR